MSDLKTRPTGASLRAFLESLDPIRRDEAQTLIPMMQSLTGEPAQLWGPSIVGFGSYHYRYASSREGDWFLTGFAPRKRDLVVYLMSGFAGADALLARLGPHRTGKSCLYIRRLEQIDFAVLEALVAGSIATLRRRHGVGGLSAQEPHTPS